MPRLQSRKNLRYPTVDGQVLSSTSKGVQSWVDNKSVGISTLGATVGTANTIKFASGVDVSIVAGVASVSVDKASKTVTKYTATADQTTFDATYALGYVDVFLNGVKLAEDQYTASNGTSIVLDEGATIDDIIEIVAFNFATGESSGGGSIAGIDTAGTSTFNNLNATGVITAASFVGDGSSLTGVASTDNIITGTAVTFTGNVNISGVATVGLLTAYTTIKVGAAITMDSASGIVTATSFSGDGSNLTGIISGVEVKNNGTSVGTGITAINFSTNVTATASGGIATVTASGGGGGGSDGPSSVMMGMIF